MKRRMFVGAVVVVAAGLLARAQTNRPQLLGISSSDAFYDASTIQEVRLDLNARDWQSLKDHFRENTYYPADFRWKDQVVRNIGIRSRGLASRSGVKPSLRLDFNRYTDGQQFLGLKSTILKNDITDPSYMHERISMELFRRIGVPAPRETHAKLFINGSYAGLYTLVEAVDKDLLRENFGENDGYLFSYQWTFPYYFEDRGTDSGAYVPVPFEPETHESDAHPEVLVEMIQTANHAANFAAEMAPFMDLKKFAKHIAVENFVADTDDFLGNQGMANFYLYRFENTKRFQLIAWDKTEAFNSPLFDIFQHIRGVTTTQTNRLVAGALAQPDVLNTYLDTLLQCAASVSEPGPSDPRGWLDREIDRIDGQIRDAGRTDPVKPFTNGQYDDEILRLHDFAAKRGPFVVQSVNSAR